MPELVIVSLSALATAETEPRPESEAELFVLVVTLFEKLLMVKLMVLAPFTERSASTAQAFPETLKDKVPFARPLDDVVDAEHLYAPVKLVLPDPIYGEKYDRLILVVPAPLTFPLGPIVEIESQANLTWVLVCSTSTYIMGLFKRVRADKSQTKLLGSVTVS